MLAVRAETYAAIKKPIIITAKYVRSMFLIKGSSKGNGKTERLTNGNKCVFGVPIISGYNIQTIKKIKDRINSLIKNARRPKKKDLILTALMADLMNFIFESF